MGVLEGRVAVVTGSGRGIGRSAATVFARSGAAVVVNARTASDVDAAVRHINDAGGQAIGVTGDVSDERFVATLVRAGLDRWGHIDILVNCAGIVGPMRPVGWDEPDLWRTCVDVNLWGTYLTTRAVIPHMARRRYGKVVNVASPGAFVLRGSLTAYATSKAAIVRLTTVVALQTARYRIDVNAINVIGATALTREIASRGDADPVHAEWWRRRLDGGHIPGPEANDELMLWLVSPESDGFTGRYVGWGMPLEDIRANKERIVASPDALRMSLNVPSYIGETEDVRRYRAASAEILAAVERELGPLEPSID
jgi:NAD(P)-dependent dehydrogenase (short-subunit alcohol dehydrogenase family)